MKRYVYRNSHNVILAKAGIQEIQAFELDSRLRGNDNGECWGSKSIFYLIIILSFIFLAISAEASTTPPGLSSQPVDITADKLYYDKKNDIVYATGNVIIQQGGEMTMAQDVVYHRTSNELYASGDVALLRDDGSVYFGQKAKFDRINTRGVILDFKGRFGTQSAIASKYVEMLDENLVEMNNLVYSTCNICATNFVPNTPLWQFRAGSAVLDREREEITYYNARVEAFGYPVLYTPYLLAPAPGAKSKSGLLIPEVRWSKTFGKVARIPYYLKMARNMDATIGVGLYEREGNVYDMEFRHRLRGGEYKLFSSITHTTRYYDTSGQPIHGKKTLKGHYDFRGIYHLQDGFVRGDLTVESKWSFDKLRTYMKKYKFSTEDVLRTDAHFRRVESAYFASIRALAFQDLRPNTSDKTTPALLPEVTYLYSNNIERLGDIRADILLDYTNLFRMQGESYNRMVSEWSVSKVYLSSFGLFWKNQAKLRADFYDVDFKTPTVVSSYIPNRARSGSESRYHPEFITSFNMPMYWPGSFITIDPIFQAIFSGRTGVLRRVDNEDSQAPELSAFSIFTSNRYKGYDMIETGNRLNYGLAGTMRTTYFDSVSFTMGQSYRFYNDPNFRKNSGLSGHKSDYVARANIKVHGPWSVGSDVRLDPENYRLNRTISYGSYNMPHYNISLFHFYMSSRLLESGLYKQELSLNGSYHVYGDWWVSGFVKTKLGKKPASQSTRMIEDGLAIRNTNECLSTEFTIQRDYGRINDLRPSTTYVIRMIIPAF